MEYMVISNCSGEKIYASLEEAVQAIKKEVKVEVAA